MASYAKLLAMAGQINSDVFVKLVAQANLTLTPKEISQIRPQLNEALNAIKVFDELDTKNVPLLAQPIEDLHNVMRDDLVEPSLSQSQALSQAAHTHQDYILVKAVFENEDN